MEAEESKRQLFVFRESKEGCNYLVLDRTRGVNKTKDTYNHIISLSEGLYKKIREVSEEQKSPFDRIIVNYSVPESLKGEITFNKIQVNSFAKLHDFEEGQIRNIIQRLNDEYQSGRNKDLVRKLFWSKCIYSFH